MFLPRGKLFILGIHRDQTRQKNCTSLSLRKTEIILPINSTKSNSHTVNTKTQLMREQEANILLLLNSIKYNILSFHSGDVGQIARPRKGKNQISTPWGESIKSKATPSGMNALSTPLPPGITLIGA